MTISLWVEASRDYDREDADLRLSRAKVAVSSLWPFLSLAKTAAEFEQRLDLAQDTIAMRVEAGMLDTVNVSLREDFGIVTTGTVPVTAQRHEVDELAEWRMSHRALRDTEGDLWDNIPQLKTDMPQVTASAPTIPPQPTSPRPTVPRPCQMQIFSLATRSWITVEANDDSAPDSRGNPVGNPYYFDGATEEGPHTGETGMYPVSVDGPDPISPLQSEYPMQPTAWTPNNAWVERPMQFNTRSAANENYFSGGTEGVGGDPQTGFPEDVSLPEEDERVDFYGNVPPVHGSIQTESEYHYVKPNPDGDGYVVTQKGTGKILSHHDTKEDAEASFRAMMWSKHSGSKALPDFRDRSGSVHVLADLGDNPYSGTDNTATNSPVAPPPTMMPGGPGAEAQPPNTNSTSPSDQAAKTSRRLTSAEVRERPSAENPTGVPDEFDSNTWEGFNNQRPRQNAEDRRVNTPQRPREPIHQNTSSGVVGGDGEDEDEGNEREAALHVAAWAVSQALEGIAA